MIGSLFLTEKPTNMSDICRLPPAPGPCRAAIHQWYYNPKKQRCSQFMYGGCGGNDNNFNSKDDCKAACMRTKGKDRWSLTVMWWENYHKMLVEAKLKGFSNKRKRAKTKTRRNKRKRPHKAQ